LTVLSSEKIDDRAENIGKGTITTQNREVHAVKVSIKDRQPRMTLHAGTPHPAAAFHDETLLTSGHFPVDRRKEFSYTLLEKKQVLINLINQFQPPIRQSSLRNKQ